MDDFNDSEDEFTNQRENVQFDEEVDSSDGEVQVFDMDSEESEDEKLLAKFKMHHRTNVNADDESEKEEEEEEEIDQWGQKANYYQSDDDLDEEDLKNEEEEALKIQKAQLLDLQESDFFVPSKVKNKSISSKVQRNIAHLSDKEKAKLLKTKLPLVLEYANEFKRVKDLDFNQNLKDMYLMNIAFYLALVCREPDAKEHPVLETLNKLKQLVEIALNTQEEEDFEGIDSGEESLGAIENSDDQEEMFEEEEDIEDEETAEEKEALPIEEYVPIAKVKKSKNNDFNDEFGETITINEADLLDKKERKRSLRFHANRVEKSMLKHDIIKESETGDFENLGRKEKTQKKEKEAADEEAEGLADLYAENDIQESDFMFDESAEDNSDKEYYNQVKQQNLDRKKAKNELHEQLKAEFEPAREAPEQLEDDEKRKATYKILQNRGLTPYRKKENRNPRVKKRIKYDNALKKLKSVRRVAVDKNKVGKYQGEATGIKSNLARSVKF